jgi:hypothetical protein
MLVFFTVLTLLFFSNTIFYTIALLIIVFLSLMTLNSARIVSTLTSLMLVIVYVGAIIIIIGYICAVSPNFVTSSSLSLYSLPPLLFLGLLVCGTYWFGEERGLSTPVDYFYSRYGIILFIVIVVILFITLLIVTSQYSSPKGPFRSL